MIAHRTTMVGQGSGRQKELFYSFNLDDHFPVDQLLRGIDRCLDLGEVHLNLAYRRFCRPGLEDAAPHHSTFSNNRQGRFRENDASRLVFESVVARESRRLTPLSACSQ